MQPPIFERLFVRLANTLVVFAVLTCFAPRTGAQVEDQLVAYLVKQQLQTDSVVADQLRHFMLARVPHLQLPRDAAQWNTEITKLRARELEIIYHGWPQAWIDAPPKFEEVGTLEGRGYRIRKLRYEVVPGMYSAALLYEPEQISGKIPAVLNVYGHLPGGKGVDFEQKRRINEARRGILALSLEWFAFGELTSPENEHSFVGHLDLAGANGLGLFYLEMRRGLDYLYNDPRVDRSRIGVTGLSGGGWQTIVLSSLDPRVTAAIPVAGFCSLTTAIEHPEYAGDDAEQNASDFRQGVDYAQLTAMRAPRPTLLTYNATDDCCFRAGAVKQGVYLDIQPFFRLYGQEQNLQWHENFVPGTHNYERDNREALYRFLDSTFSLKAPSTEDGDTDQEIKKSDELTVGLPKDNLTILGLAQKLARSNHQAANAATPATAKRERLRAIVRYHPTKVERAWVLNSLDTPRVEAHAYRFDFDNGLSATGVLFHAAGAVENPPAVILVRDEGKEAAAGQITSLVSNGKSVLVFEPLFFGQNVPGTGDLGVSSYAQMLNGLGERALGLEAAQIVAVAKWLNTGPQHGSPTPGATIAATAEQRPVDVSTSGPRSGSVTITAAALEPRMFRSVDAQHAISTLSYVLEHPLKYGEVPELMCLDLFRYFDFDSLADLAAPAKVHLDTGDSEPATH